MRESPARRFVLCSDKPACKSLVIENSSHRKSFRLYVIDGKLVINICGAPFERGDKDAPTALRVLNSFKPT